jgi:tetrahydromethanopterin S-methyltransferase subunit A
MARKFFVLNKMKIPEQAAPALHEIERGMELKKCRKCGCMLDALQNAERAFGSADESEVRALLPVIDGFKSRTEPIAYDCIGCKKCWGADATIHLAEQFEEVGLDACGSNACPAEAEVNRTALATEKQWPPYPGDYIVGNSEGTVAICTLSSRELPVRIIASNQPHIAIAGRCDTENIGIEKVVLNILANPHIRWLVLAGIEAPGHRAADAFLQLKSNGVDTNMRVLKSASWRPVLKNLTLRDVARYREQVQLVSRVGTTQLDAILNAAHDSAAQTLSPLPAYIDSGKERDFERIRAAAPKELKLDRAGFFIILRQQQRGLIVCEHYENSGRLAHVIEGRSAALIASSAVERGLVTRLDHAAYLGRELAKAELALKTGADYEQDAALGELPKKWQEETQ